MPDLTPPPLPSADLDHVLLHTRTLWEEMRGERIFITGGTGFFGCWLLESFRHANRELGLGAKATVLTRDAKAFARKAPHLAEEAAIALVEGDARSFEFPQEDHAFVIHAATDSGSKQTESGPLELALTIADGTRRALEFARSHGTRKLLLTSSGAVYGRQPSEVVHLPETYGGAPDPLLAASSYGESKRYAEQLCAAASSGGTGLECKIARCFAFVGPHLPLDAHFAIGNFIRDAMEGRPIRIGGDGTPCRSYLYAADLAIWLWTMLFRAPALRAFNVGSEESMSIADLARATAATLRPGLEIAVAVKPDASAPVVRYVPSTQRAGEELGLRTLVVLQDAIRRTAAWHGYAL
ncbi:MAG: NAD-dependent epimerase/dehydratase family protein [Acidobacteriaceae bacterium]